MLSHKLVVILGIAVVMCMFLFVADNEVNALPAPMPCQCKKPSCDGMCGQDSYPDYSEPCGCMQPDCDRCGPKKTYDMDYPGPCGCQKPDCDICGKKKYPCGGCQKPECEYCGKKMYPCGGCKKQGCGYCGKKMYPCGGCQKPDCDYCGNKMYKPLPCGCRKPKCDGSCGKQKVTKVMVMDYSDC